MKKVASQDPQHTAFQSQLRNLTIRWLVRFPNSLGWQESWGSWLWGGERHNPSRHRSLPATLGSPHCLHLATLGSPHWPSLQQKRVSCCCSIKTKTQIMFCCSHKVCPLHSTSSFSAFRFLGQRVHPQISRTKQTVGWKSRKAQAAGAWKRLKNTSRSPDNYLQPICIGSWISGMANKSILNLFRLLKRCHFSPSLNLTWDKEWSTANRGFGWCFAAVGPQYNSIGVYLWATICSKPACEKKTMMHHCRWLEFWQTLYVPTIWESIVIRLRSWWWWGDEVSERKVAVSWAFALQLWRLPRTVKTIP